MPHDKRSNSISRSSEKGGFSVMHLEHTSGYRLAVCEYGGQVLSWTHPSGRELLFLSRTAAFEAGKAIRGGIPVVFPQFGKGSLPSHGFARLKPWAVVREHASDSGAVSVVLRLSSDAETESMWPHRFALELEIELSDALRTTLRVSNAGEGPLCFFSALHTYFAVSDAERCVIQGLQGMRYVDFLAERQESMESAPELALAKATDRAYVRSPDTVLICDSAQPCTFSVTKRGFADTVVWNPWQEGNLALQDLAPGSWHEMVCVESGNVLEPVTVAAGATHESSQVLRASIGM